MWPKAFAQFVELAPHVSRLLPLADRFLKDKAAGETAAQKTSDATQKAMEEHRQTLDTMASGLRGDLSQLTTFQTGLQAQLDQLDTHVSTTRADALAAKLAIESMAARLTGIEARQSRAHSLLTGMLILMAAVLILLALPYVRGH